LPEMNLQNMDLVTLSKQDLAHHVLMELNNQYQAGRLYQNQMGFGQTWPEYENMKVGKQWPDSTPKTRHLPRPVFNIIELIVHHKTASVLNENIKMLFSVPVGDEGPLAYEAADSCTDFSRALWDQINQADLNKQVMDMAATTGTGIWHYYWDADYFKPGHHKYAGRLVGESIDPVNCFFGNPQIRNVQEQPWVLIASRERVEQVKKRARQNGLTDYLVAAEPNPNSSYYEAARLEGGEDYVTLLTRYWRDETGKVLFAQSTSGQMITPPTDTGLTLYPLEVMNWKIRKRSIYGVSEVEGLVPNQRSINFLMAMLLLSVQDTAWPKVLVKPGALNQVLTNMPGEIVVDNSPLGDGIRYMSPAPISGQALSLVEKVYELTRNVVGASEIITGENFTSQMSGAAIIAMQKAASIPVEQIKKRFLRSLVNIGHIWEEFFKAKYGLALPLAGEKQKSRLVRGTNYAGIPLDLKVEVGASADYSEALMMANLENFLSQGHITFEEALEFMPDNVVPFKHDLLAKVQERNLAKSMMAQEMAASQQSTQGILE